jgi:tRNA nucleotidyltransferase (CCA-adding enzyme)
MLSPADALDSLRRLPRGARVLDAVAGEPAAWIVGGAVRDAMLGREPREIDVVVEGDPAATIAALGGTVREHDRFGTAVVELADGERIDVVRARAESYAAPGALPDVRPGTLEEDLARRDLTANAIALRANEDGVQVRSAPGALDDLEAGILRVLHDASFVDDPTRLWRVARYAARLGFRVDPHTAALAAAADPGTVSGVRLGNELRLALREPAPLAALAQARALNARLLPAALETQPAGLEEALALLPDDARADLVVLAACSAGVDAAELVAWLDALGFTAAERDVVAAGSRWLIGAPLRAACTPAEIARAARGAPVEVVALAGGPNAHRWLHELRHVRLEITGADLLAAGVPEGPEVGRRLQQALDRKLDGEVSGREEELAAALA